MKTIIIANINEVWITFDTKEQLLEWLPEQVTVPFPDGENYKEGEEQILYIDDIQIGILKDNMIYLNLFYIKTKIKDKKYYNFFTNELQKKLSKINYDKRKLNISINGSDMWGTHYRKGLPVYNFKDEIKVLRNERRNDEDN